MSLKQTLWSRSLAYAITCPGKKVFGNVLLPATLMRQVGDGLWRAKEPVALAQLLKIKLYALEALNIRQNKGGQLWKACLLINVPPYALAAKIRRHAVVSCRGADGTLHDDNVAPHSIYGADEELRQPVLGLSPEVGVAEADMVKPRLVEEHGGGANELVQPAAGPPFQLGFKPLRVAHNEMLLGANSEQLL